MILVLRSNSRSEFWENFAVLQYELMIKSGVDRRSTFLQIRCLGVVDNLEHPP
jgi:hypothetical protein